MNKGFTKLYRKIFNNDYFKINHDAFYLFNYFIAKCNYEPTDVNGIKLKRGQFITSFRKLSDATFIDISKVRRIIKKLEKDKMIRCDGKQNYTIITVLNYSKYQDKSDTLFDTQTDTQTDTQKDTLKVNNNRTNSKSATHFSTHKATHKPTQKPTTEKKYKEIKEDKEYIYSQIQDAYNDTCKTLPRCTTITTQRKKLLDARLKDYSLDDFKTVFTLANKSDFKII